MAARASVASQVLANSRHDHEHAKFEGGMDDMKVDINVASTAAGAAPGNFSTTATTPSGEKLNCR